MEAQVGVLGDGGLPNYDLMCDVTNFLCHFGARYHHAREDIAFGYIVRSNPAMSGTIDRLVQEHADIAAKGEELAALLGRVFARAETGVAKAVVAFLILYRNHITSEEESILPYAAEHLSAMEWDSVAAAAPLGPDPFQMYGVSRHSPTFGSEAEVRYLALYEMIQAGRSMQSSAYPMHPAIDSPMKHATYSKQVGGILVLPDPQTFVPPISRRARRLLVRQAIGCFALILAYLQYYYHDVQLQIMNLLSVVFFQ
jgi:hypothetical protein